MLFTRGGDGTYGFCEETGSHWSQKINSQAIATLSIEAQERHRKRRKDIY